MKFQIRTPARLHMSLIDLNGYFERIDGGFGLSVSEPYYLIEFSNESEISFLFNGPQKLLEITKNLIDRFYKSFPHTQTGLELSILHEIPSHVGLGSKTQYLLTILRGLTVLHKIDLSPNQYAEFINRGGTSGIGYQTFHQGGFILDLGHSLGINNDKKSFLPSSASSAPPALPFYHTPMPSHWQVLLVHLNVKQGANQEKEVNIFQSFTPLPLQEVQEISHCILMQLIPSILQKDIHIMAKALNYINSRGFKAIEIRLQDKYVTKLINMIFTEFQYPVGMSSFGPIIFVLVDSLAIKEEIKLFIQAHMESDLDSPGGIITEACIDNDGHQIFML